MKARTIVISYIVTVLSVILIINAGYRLLAYAGKKCSIINETALPVSNQSSDTYIFFSETNDDISLYPWNRFAEAEPYAKLYGIADVYKIFAFDKMYDSILYYLYKTLPEDIMAYITTNNVSLWKCLGFDMMENHLKVTSDNLFATYLFYTNSFHIKKQYFTLKCAFDTNCDILSFQLIHDEARQAQDSIQDIDILDTSKNYLSNYLNDSERNQIPGILYDILSNENLYSNYTLNNTLNPVKQPQTNEEPTTALQDPNETASEGKDTIMEYDGQYIEKYEDELEFLKEVLTTIQKEVSYQIVSTDDEILIILIEYDMVLHYDPYSDMIVGFHKSGAGKS